MGRGISKTFVDGGQKIAIDQSSKIVADVTTSAAVRSKKIRPCKKDVAVVDGFEQPIRATSKRLIVVLYVRKRFIIEADAKEEAVIRWQGLATIGFKNRGTASWTKGCCHWRRRRRFRLVPRSGNRLLDGRCRQMFGIERSIDRRLDLFGKRRTKIRRCWTSSFADGGRRQAILLIVPETGQYDGCDSSIERQCGCGRVHEDEIRAFGDVDPSTIGCGIGQRRAADDKGMLFLDS